MYIQAVVIMAIPYVPMHVNCILQYHANIVCSIPNLLITVSSKISNYHEKSQDVRAREGFKITKMSSSLV